MTPRRVVVRTLGEDPGQAIEACTALEAFEPPAPEALAPRDVLIEVRAANVGWVDLLMTSGQYQHMPPLPYTPGLEYAGVVAAAGAEAATRCRPGDRVLVDGFTSGPRSLGAYQQSGGFATHALAPVDAVLPIPGALTFDEAACLLGNYETAWHCLVARGRVQPGEIVLIPGASGSTGLAAVQVCGALGAKVVATGRSAEKLALVRAHGGEHVLGTIDTSSLPAGETALRDAVRELTAGRGVDVVHDGVGGETSLACLRCLRFGGRFLIVGWAGTPLVARGRGLRGAPNANVLPTNLLMMKGLDVLGCPTVISTVQDPSLRAPRLAQVLDWATTGRIRPFVSHRFPLDAYREAMQAKWRAEVTGGCVLQP